MIQKGCTACLEQKIDQGIFGRDDLRYKVIVLQKCADQLKVGRTERSCSGQQIAYHLLQSQDGLVFGDDVHIDGGGIFLKGSPLKLLFKEGMTGIGKITETIGYGVMYQLVKKKLVRRQFPDACRKSFVKRFRHRDTDPLVQFFDHIGLHKLMAGSDPDAEKIGKGIDGLELQPSGFVNPGDVITIIALKNRFRVFLGDQNAIVEEMIKENLSHLKTPFFHG